MCTSILIYDYEFFIYKKKLKSLYIYFSLLKQLSEIASNQLTMKVKIEN
jgi:hypothetical protein